LTVAALVCSVPAISTAQSAAAGLLEQANQAYEEGRYDDAVRDYEEILASGVTHGAVLYNLGNAYFKTDRLGAAILAYERARQLLPRDEDVAANLQLARELTVDKIIQEEHPLIIRWITTPARTLNTDELTRVSFILYLLTAALAAMGVWIRPGRWRKKILVSALITGILLFISGGSLAGKIYRQRSVTRAVILAPSVDARSGPGDDYTKIFTAHEGTTVRVRQQREGWCLIALPNGLGGWIPDPAAEHISRR
jgi:tetratricopeptide (TPR) repeat protein